MDEAAVIYSLLQEYIQQREMYRLHLLIINKSLAAGYSHPPQYFYNSISNLDIAKIYYKAQQMDSSLYYAQNPWRMHKEQRWQKNS